MTKSNSKPHLELIQGKRLTSGEFALLALKDKIEYLQKLSARSKLEMILAEPQPAPLVRSLPPEELYRLLHDIGAENSLEIFQMASMEQIRFIFDWELWDRWTLSTEKTLKWLELLLSAGVERAVQIISGIDRELLLIFLKKCIMVGGGLGDIVGSEDHQQEWDHTFDEIYFIRFIDTEQSEFAMRLLDLIYRKDHDLYQSLMMGVENELLSELEELAFQFRSNRLADEGFPSTAGGARIYSRMATEGFKPARDKMAPQLQEFVIPPPAVAGDRTNLFGRAFARADSSGLRQEFRYLTNNAVAAEGIAPADHEKMVPVLERIDNYLNIALEYLCGGAEDKAAEILQGEHLTRLFALGHSLLMQLQDRAKQLETENYATEKLLTGLRMHRPRFYRGLDPDTVDNYREFAGMDDLRKIDSILKKLEEKG